MLEITPEKWWVVDFIILESFIIHLVFTSNTVLSVRHIVSYIILFLVMHHGTYISIQVSFFRGLYTRHEPAFLSVLFHLSLQPVRIIFHPKSFHIICQQIHIPHSHHTLCFDLDVSSISIP